MNAMNLCAEVGIVESAGLQGTTKEIVLSHDLAIDELVNEKSNFFKALHIKAILVLCAKQQICQHPEPVVVMKNGVDVVVGDLREFTTAGF